MIEWGENTIRKKELDCRMWVVGEISQQSLCRNGNIREALKSISEKRSSNSKKLSDKKRSLDFIVDFNKLYMLYVCSTLFF